MSLLGRLSRIINRITGGPPRQTLCARIALARGANCGFCRLIARFTEPNHCADELRRWLAVAQK